MKIGNRKRKIQSDKIVKELIMYLDLLSSGKVYQSEPNISTAEFEYDRDFTGIYPKIESSTSLRSFQRYAKDLKEAGAIPSLELKRDPEDDDAFYSVEKYETKQPNPNNYQPKYPLSFVVKKEDVAGSFAKYLKDYRGFNVNHSEAHIARLARMCKFANGICRSSEKNNIKTDNEAKGFLENFYRNNIDSNYNQKTFLRDADVLIITLNEVFNCPKSDRYKEVMGKFLREHHRFQFVLQCSYIWMCTSIYFYKQVKTFLH